MFRAAKDWKHCNKQWLKTKDRHNARIFKKTAKYREDDAKYYEKLKAECVDTQLSYEERVKMREFQRDWQRFVSSDHKEITEAAQLGKLEAKPLKPGED